LDVPEAPRNLRLKRASRRVPPSEVDTLRVR